MHKKCSRSEWQAGDAQRPPACGGPSGACTVSRAKCSALAQPGCTSAGCTGCLSGLLRTVWRPTYLVIRHNLEGRQVAEVVAFRWQNARDVQQAQAGEGAQA